MGKESDPITSSVIMTNVMLGTGPIIIPPVFLLAGVGLASIWTFVTVFFSYYSAELIVESISIINALSRSRDMEEHHSHYDKMSLPAIDQDGDSAKHDIGDRTTKYPDLSSSFENTPPNASASAPEAVKQQLLDASERNMQELFKLNEVYELAQMGGFLFGKKGQVTVTIMIVAYMFGVVVSKCIVTGNTMSQVFSDVPVLKEYYFWVLFFFLCSASFSFKDVGSIKLLQIIIGIVRASVILLFIGGPIYLVATGTSTGSLSGFGKEYINQDGQLQNYVFGAFDFQNFGVLFSNLTFAFMMHHSLPQMVGTCKPESKIKITIIGVFVFATIVTYAISLLGILAFGGELCNPFKPSSLTYFSQDFQGHINWIYYYSSFYIFLNVAALPVLTIVLRTNLMKLITPQHFPEQSFQITKWTLIYTCGILAVVIACALTLKKYIQYVLNITGGLFGVLIMITVPTTFVIFGRRRVTEHFGRKITKYMHRAILPWDILPYIIGPLSLILFGYNLYLNILNFIKPSGGGH